MKIKTKVVTIDRDAQDQNELLGKDINKIFNKEYMEFELSEVGAIMPYKKSNKMSVIFIQGKDMVIDMDYQTLSQMWNNKNQ